MALELRAKRRPNRERERLGIIVNRYLDVAANEKLLLVHDALVGSKFHPLIELALGDKRSPRRLDAEAQRNVSVFNPAGGACPFHDSVRGRSLTAKLNDRRRRRPAGCKSR